MKVAIDRELCIGCGVCAGICPEVFEMDEENIAKVTAQPDAGSEDCAKEAAESCPVGAIAVE